MARVIPSSSRSRTGTSSTRSLKCQSRSWQHHTAQRHDQQLGGRVFVTTSFMFSVILFTSSVTNINFSMANAKAVHTVRSALLSRALGKVAVSATAATDIAAATTPKANTIPQEMLAEEAVAAVKDEWQAEAQRCWGLDDDGLVTGLIPTMMTADNDGPVEERPWRRLPGEPEAGYRAPTLYTREDHFIYYHSKKQARESPDACAKDYAMAMKYFGMNIEAQTEPKVVLDIGSGDALMARRFAQSGRFSRVYAIDIGSKQIEAARNAAEQERTGPGQGLLLLRADVQKLPLRDGQADFAWWGLGMHLVKDKQAALQNIGRVLRPGGRLVATTLSQHFMPEQIAKLLTDAGFVEIQLKVPRFALFTVQAIKE